jgi:hypothetical protein
MHQKREMRGGRCKIPKQIIFIKAGREVVSLLFIPFLNGDLTGAAPPLQK